LQSSIEGSILRDFFGANYPDGGEVDIVIKQSKIPHVCHRCGFTGWKVTQELSKEIDQVHVSLGNGLIEGKCQVARGW